MRKNYKKGGFTLIELMVVVIIIAALAGMVLPRLVTRADEAKEHIAQGGIAGITTALQLYRLHNHKYPTTDEGLNALVTKPTSARDWKGPYLEKKKYLDPWKQPYKYKQPGAHNTDGFDLWSIGVNPDDESDDINNWDE